MLTLEEQLSRGALVCPRSHARLVRDGSSLRGESRGTVYPIVDGVPVLLSDPAATALELVKHDAGMSREYAARRQRRPLRSAVGAVERWVGDRRSPASRRALAEV